jgi:hypothetical protein
MQAVAADLWIQRQHCNPVDMEHTILNCSGAVCIIEQAVVTQDKYSLAPACEYIRPSSTCNRDERSVTLLKHSARS